jgi:hypothetical protein
MALGEANRGPQWFDEGDSGEPGAASDMGSHVLSQTGSGRVIGRMEGDGGELENILLGGRSGPGTGV